MTMTLPNHLARGDDGGVHDGSCTGPADRCHRRCSRLGSVDFRAGLNPQSGTQSIAGAMQEAMAPSLSCCCAYWPPSGAS